VASSGHRVFVPQLRGYGGMAVSSRDTLEMANHQSWRSMRLR
jgi:hypothetical protein